MKKTFVMALALAATLSLSLCIAAYASGAFDENSSSIDSPSDLDGCSAVISDDQEKLSYRERLEMHYAKYREDPNPFDLNDPATWFADAKDGGLSDETASLAKSGMSIAEAVELLGEPQRDVGSGIPIFEWDMRSGEILQISFSIRKPSDVAGEGWKSGSPIIYMPDEND